MFFSKNEETKDSDIDLIVEFEPNTKNLLEKNETIDTVTIDAKLINIQKNEVLKEAYKIKEAILNCDVASASAKKAVDFENFDELFSKTWLAKDILAEYSYFKK